MSDAMRALAEWKRNNGPGFASRWIERLQAGDQRAYHVDHARRKVKSYFEKITRIYSAGLIRLKLFQEIAYAAGRSIVGGTLKQSACEPWLRTSGELSNRKRA